MAIITQTSQAQPFLPPHAWPIYLDFCVSLLTEAKSSGVRGNADCARKPNPPTSRPITLTQLRLRSSRTSPCSTAGPRTLDNLLCSSCAVLPPNFLDRSSTRTIWLLRHQHLFATSYPLSCLHGKSSHNEPAPFCPQHIL